MEDFADTISKLGIRSFQQSNSCDALARRQAAEDLKQSYYEQAVHVHKQNMKLNLHVEEAELNIPQYRLEETQQPQQSQQAVSPLDDPESALSKLIQGVA